MASIYREYFNPDKVREHYNYTRRGADGTGGPARRAASALTLLLCSLVVLENLLVLLSVCRGKRLRSAMFVFIGNLAASDLLAGVAFMANVLLSGTATFRLTPLQWFAREGTAFAALAASVFSLLAIAVERHVAVSRVRAYGGGGRRVALLVGACWAVAAALAGLPALGWNCLREPADCSTVLPLYSRRYVLFVAAALTLILLAVVALYGRIYCVVRASRAGAVPALPLLKTVTLVLGAFVVCWLPAFVVLLLDACCPARAARVLRRANYVFAFATLNSAANPLIYTLRSEDMRREFRRLLCCCWRRRRRRRGDAAGTPPPRGDRDVPVPPLAPAVLVQPGPAGDCTTSV